MFSLFHLSTLFPLIVGMVSYKLLPVNRQSHPLHISGDGEGLLRKGGGGKESGSITVEF